MAEQATLGALVDTAAGPVQHLDLGTGEPVLFVHGSPGGCDEGEQARLHPIEGGTHISVWTGPDDDLAQAVIVDFLRDPMR